MGKFKPDTSNDIARSPKQFLSGTNLSDVQKVERTKLRPNPKNEEYFSRESTEYFERLENDIRERGIIVPLLAKEDGTLLAGHNRLIIAEKLNLKFVPVQYVKQEMSAADEQAFVIKDNLFRRQFSSSEWMNIYRKLYPDFDERIAEGNKAGKPKKNALTAVIIAKDTGQKPDAVRKQFQRAKSGTNTGGKNAKLDSVQLSKISKKPTIIETAQKLVSDWEKASATEKKQVLSMLKRLS